MPSENMTRGILLKHMNTLAPRGIAVDVAKTKHEVVLSTEELQELYQTAVLFHFNPSPIWPADWLGKTINELVEHLARDEQEAA